MPQGVGPLAQLLLYTPHVAAGAQGYPHSRSVQGKRFTPLEKLEHLFKVQPWEDSQHSTATTLATSQDSLQPS